MTGHRVVIGGIAGLFGIITIVLALAGCASSEETPAVAQRTLSPSPTPTSDTSATSTPPPGPATASLPANPVRTITVSIRAGKVDPPPDRIKVPRGETVRLVVTSDVADELHVHGYDREVALPAGRPATLEFTADQAGLFQVETHETEKVLFQLLVE
jgi:cytoskeletal protein RodZ